MAKDLDSKLKEMDEKIKQIQTQKQELIKKTKADERKKRNHELIQIGAIFESIGIKTTTQASQLKAEILNKPEILQGIVNQEEKSPQDEKPSEDKTHEE